MILRALPIMTVVIERVGVIESAGMSEYAGQSVGFTSYHRFMSWS